MKPRLTIDNSEVIHSSPSSPKSRAVFRTVGANVINEGPYMHKILDRKAKIKIFAKQKREFIALQGFYN